MLSDKLGKTYAKNSLEMYKLLEAKQKTVIKNAKTLYESQKALPCHLQNPVTTVFRLVEKLRGE
jgi:hypothetical protein